MTPLGQSLFDSHKNDADFDVTESNDPFKVCDPIGFPRNVVFQTRGIGFSQMADRVIALYQYNRAWREILTDGRELPKNVGGSTKGAPDPRWNGYSVGHWEGDYTFVVDTAGSDDRSWLDHMGHPHSVGMRAEERYTRVDHDTLEMLLTFDDPKMYTKPIQVQKITFKWIPQQEFEEQICVPSEASDYLNTITNPAAGR